MSIDLGGIGGWRGTRRLLVLRETLARGPSSAAGLAGHAVMSLAMQDWMVGSYLLVLLGAVLLGHGPGRATAITCLLGDSAVFWTCVLAARATAASRWAKDRTAPWMPRLASGLLYRVGLVGAVVASFLQLHYIMPAASDFVLDAQIYRLDLAVFGFEPAVSWDRFVTPRTTEWFSFFYFGYFSLLCLYVVPIALFEGRARILSELSLGLLFVVCAGHCLYLFVPGRGPYLAMAGHFDHPLTGGFWWPLVASTVESVDGALRKDIFPSLHTACPTFLTLFTFRNRAHRPYRYLWPLTALFTSQIILATMFLRWHYLADVVAGVTLATAAFFLSTYLVGSEARIRVQRGLSPVWRPLFSTK